MPSHAPTLQLQPLPPDAQAARRAKLEEFRARRTSAAGNSVILAHAPAPTQRASAPATSRRPRPHGSLYERLAASSTAASRARQRENVSVRRKSTNSHGDRRASHPIAGLDPPSMQIRDPARLPEQTAVQLPPVREDPKLGLATSSPPLAAPERQSPNTRSQDNQIPHAPNVSLLDSGAPPSVESSPTPASDGTNNPLDWPQSPNVAGPTFEEPCSSMVDHGAKHTLTELVDEAVQEKEKEWAAESKRQAEIVRWQVSKEYAIQSSKILQRLFQQMNQQASEREEGYQEYIEQLQSEARDRERCIRDLERALKESTARNEQLKELTDTGARENVRPNWVFKTNRTRMSS